MDKAYLQRTPKILHALEKDKDPFRLFSVTTGAERANKYSHGGIRCFPAAAGFHPTKVVRRAKSASVARSPTHASPIFTRGPHRFTALRVRERGPLETALGQNKREKRFWELNTHTLLSLVPLCNLQTIQDLILRLR
jgi:hypothetical protein